MPIIFEGFENALKEFDSHFHYGVFKEKRKSIHTAFDELFQLFQDSITGEKFLENQIIEAKKQVSELNAKRWDFDIDDIIPSFQDRLETCLNYDDLEIDQDLISEIKSGLMNSRVKIIIQKIICDYYKKSKDIDKLSLAVQLKYMIDEYNIKC